MKTAGNGMVLHCLTMPIDLFLDEHKALTNQLDLTTFMYIANFKMCQHLTASKGTHTAVHFQNRKFGFVLPFCFLNWTTF